jgi:hypothetical protein
LAIEGERRLARAAAKSSTLAQKRMARYVVDGVDVHGPCDAQTDDAE